jgi:hypothetical protein
LAWLLHQQLQQSERHSRGWLLSLRQYLPATIWSKSAVAKQCSKPIRSKL